MAISKGLFTPSITISIHLTRVGIQIRHTFVDVWVILHQNRWLLLLPWWGLPWLLRLLRVGRLIFPFVAINASRVNRFVQWAPVTIATIPLCSGVDWSFCSWHNCKVLFKVRDVAFCVDWKYEEELER